MSSRASVWVLLALVLATLALAFDARLGYDVHRTRDQESGAWLSLEADSFYHMRRVARVADEGWPVAGTDPLLDYPDGAEIPWPPYYTTLVAAATTPFLPEEPAARRLAVEQVVGSLGVVFGCAAALLALLAARFLGGNSAAAFAGPCAALALGAVNYSSIGNGDHHAFVAFLHAALLFGMSWGLARGALDEPKRALRLGLLLGAVAGLALGSWVAFLAYLLEVELVLAALIFVHARKPLAGLAPFGLAFHLAALVALAPAALTSPWLAVDPWQVVNLSYFHPVFLLLGAAVFVPLLFSGGERLRPRYPWLVAAALALLAALLLALQVGPGRGLVEAFAWASREDEFMASIQESQSFLRAPGAVGGALLLTLGWGALALPFAWAAALVACRRGRLALLPWVVAVPLLALQALTQLRFAEALVVPLAVVVGWALAAAFGSSRRRLALVAGLFLGLAVQQPGLAEMLRYRRVAPSAFEPTASQAELGAARRLASKLRDAPRRAGHEGVLSTWGFGHMLEWVAERPTVATNFGGYLGDASYQFGPRAFVCEEDDTLEHMLAERRIGYLMLDSRTTENLPDIVARADPALLPDYLAGDPGRWRGALQPRWFHTALARLLLGASGTTAAVPADARRPFRFLRLVHVAPERDPEPHLAGLVRDSPRAWIWERVPGALLVAEGRPGDELSVRIEIQFSRAGFRYVHEDTTYLDEEGHGSLRIPYATRGTSGEGRVLPGATWKLGLRRAPLVIDEAAVLEGLELRLP